MENYTSPGLTPFEKGILAWKDLPEDQRAFEKVQVIEKSLTDYRRQFTGNKDPRTTFTLAYEIITKAILEKVEKRGFPHRVWLAMLDNIFGRFYFDAVDAYDHARQTEATVRRDGQRDGQKVMEAWKKVPRVWDHVFDLIGAGQAVPKFRPKAIIIEELILPLIVHTVHDLPLAVAEIAIREVRFEEEGMWAFAEKGFHCDDITRLRESDRTIRDFHTYVHDFMVINDLLFEGEYSIIDKVQEAVTTYNPFFLRWLDWILADRYDEMFTYHTLQVLRGMAWYDATRLVEAQLSQSPEAAKRSCQQIRYEIEERTITYIDLIARPKRRWRRWLLNGARFLSGLFRQWPANPLADTDEVSGLPQRSLPRDNLAV